MNQAVGDYGFGQDLFRDGKDLCCEGRDLFQRDKDLLMLRVDRLRSRHDLFRPLCTHLRRGPNLFHERQKPFRGEHEFVRLRQEFPCD